MPVPTPDQPEDAQLGASRGKRVESILESAVDGIVIIDESGHIDTFNAAAERMFGWKADEVVGKNVSVLMPEPDHSAHDGYLAQYKKTGVPQIIGIGREVQGKRKDGTTFPLQLGVSEFHDSGKRWFTGILRDVSERKLLEQEFLQAQKMEAIGRLAGGIAHDFNNLLTGILSGCRMAESVIEKGGDATTILGEVRREARRGASMTRKLLDFSRKGSPKRQRLHLNDVLSESESLLRSLVGEDVTLSIELDHTESQLLADSGQLVQVLMNLVTNARDALGVGGRISIRVRSVDVKEPGSKPGPGRWVVLEVADDGHGMDAATQEMIFEPFFTTKESGKGTGLGLSTVFGSVRELGGSIDVESYVGSGTTFRLYFPRATASEANEGSSREERVEPPAGTGRILVVEDEPLVRAGIRHFLDGLGYDVLLAGAPAEALEIAGREGEKIDLLLTDIVMPGMNGAELAKQIEVMQEGVRVLFMSAFSGDILVAQDRIDPGVPVLEKPFEEQDLAERVQALLRDAPARD